MSNGRGFPEFVYDRDVNEVPDGNYALDYLDSASGLRCSIAAQWLFVPEFVEYRGGVFFTDVPAGFSQGRRKTLDGWFEKYEGLAAPVEKIGNWLILWFQFGSDRELMMELDSELVQLGRTIRDCWDALLRVRYPDRRFEVVFTDDDDHGPQVTFHSVDR
jgi:hypothetical protein